MAPPRPDLPAAARGTAPTAVRFASTLRRAGLHADLGAVIGFARALALVDLGSEDDVRAAGAAFFVERPEERIRYDAAFDRFWLRRPPADRLPDPHGAGEGYPLSQPPTADRGPESSESVGGGEGAGAEEAVEPAGADDGTTADEMSMSSTLAYSAAETLRSKSFDEMTPEELRDAVRLVDELRPRLEQRRTRRYRLHHRGPVLAQRAMLRRSLGTAGDPLEWLWRRRRSHPRPIVAICDISGSMEQHSRLALRFIHALTRVDVRTEAFVFGTRLSRITAQLRHRHPDEALREVAASVHDWAGGTQIGQALHIFNRQWARRVLRSSAIVVIVSDGWDRGSPQMVAEEMSLLRRRCHRLIWLNPLAGTSGYEPRTAGMAAAYPHIDDFLPIGNVESLEQLGRMLGPDGPSAGVTARRPATAAP